MDLFVDVPYYKYKQTPMLPCFAARLLCLVSRRLLLCHQIIFLLLYFADLSFHPKEPFDVFCLSFFSFFKFLLLFLYRLMMREVPIHSNGLPTSRKTPRRESLMMWCRFCVSDGRFTEKKNNFSAAAIYTHTHKGYMRNRDESIMSICWGFYPVSYISISPVLFFSVWGGRAVNQLPKQFIGTRR
jgi:hypothetical protein